ncbi:hypothetical protein MCUN1_003899 [Malassezia cuniculi]|uniref:Nucleoporin Nup188 N-terminal subdomain III domain-containing protein n=1 Tax=Malassezia cuniculi TaxID=948313 RepID=A0AAF0EYC6_9BASI|nr:hypothetical protein MCUN1_003899 [Malassezia cuniculi]
MVHDERVSAPSALIPFHDLYEHLERARQSRAPAEVQSLLDARRTALAECGASPSLPRANDARLDGPSVNWRGEELRVDEDTRILARGISKRFSIDEVEALGQLRTFLSSEHRSLDSVLKAEAATDELLDAFNVFYFEERVCVVRCVSALLRITEEPTHELFDIASAALDTFADADYARRCLAWFEETAATLLPSHISGEPRYSLLWARHCLDMQLALLEVVFLMYYGRLPPSGAFALRVLESIKTTHGGQRQANAGFLGPDALVLVDCVGHQLELLALESLALEEVLDAPDAMPSIADPQSLDGILAVLDSHPPVAPVLIGYALVLRAIDEAAGDDDTSAAIRASTAVLDGGAPVWQRLVAGALHPNVDIYGDLQRLLASPLLVSARSAVLGASNLSSLAYRAVFKGALLAITELVQPEYLDLEAIVSVWAGTFLVADAPAGVPGVGALCTQFWSADAPHTTRMAVLEATRARFPVHVRPFVQLMHALSGAGDSEGPGDAVTAVLEYLAELPTLALPLPQSATSVEALDGGQYQTRVALPVSGTRIALPSGALGTLASAPADSPIVTWQVPPVSGWQILADIVCAMVRPPRARAHVFADASDVADISPDCAPGEWDTAAAIAELFVAVLHEKSGALALLAHLGDDAAEGLGGAAVDMLHIALQMRPVNLRLACAAYALLGALLPLAPNSVWQQVRASNVLIGSAGSVPLRSAPVSQSVLLGDATARAQYKGVCALLALVESLTRDALDRQWADGRDASAVKGHVLERVLGWVCDAVWAGHASWRYTNERDSLEIAVCCCRIFERVLGDHCVWSADSSLALVARLYDRVLVAQRASAPFAPLLDSISNGHTTIDQLYAQGAVGDARLAEELVERQLRLARMLVERDPTHVLVSLFFSHAPVAAHARSQMELAGAVLQYIWAPASASLCTEAARLATAMCCAGADSPTYSLAGHLGSADQLERSVASLVGVVANPYQDTTLRVAVWTLVAALVDMQPAIATLLLTGHHLAADAEQNAASALTALQLAADSVAIAAELWESEPSLLEGVLLFLNSAWAHALEHSAVFRALRTDTKFWDILGSLLARDTGDEPMGAAYRATCQARIVRLVQLDLQTRVAADVPASLRMLGGIADDKTRLAEMLGGVYASDASAVAQAAEVRVAAIGEIAALRLPPRRDEFDARRVFGAAYVYAREPFVAKTRALAEAGLLPSELDGDASGWLSASTAGDGAFEAAVTLFDHVNLAWSLADAQAARAAAWTLCLGVAAGHLWHNATDKTRASRLADSCIEAFVAVAKLPPTSAAAHASRVGCLAVLLTAGWSGDKVRAAEVVPLVASLVDLQEFPLEASLRALVEPAYHVPLLHMMLVVCSGARATRASFADVQVQSAMHAVASAALRCLGDLEWCAAALAHPASESASDAEGVLNLVVSIVEQVVHADMPLDAGAWLAPLRETSILPGAAALLGQATRVPGAPGHVLFLAPLLALIDALAAREQTAELVALAGVVPALCDHALTPLLDGGHVDAVLASGDANPIHALWLRELHVVVHLVENAGQRFIETDADAFVAMYTAQLRRTLSFAPLRPRHSRTLPLDIAQLDEIAAVARLFLGMWRGRHGQAARPGVPPRKAATMPLGAELVERAPHVLYQLVYLQQHPQELRALLGATELEEKDGAALVQAACASLLDASSALIAFLCDICACATVLTADVDDWPALPAPIHPSLHAAPGVATVGTLLEYASVLTDSLKKTDKRALTEVALEQCLLLCVTQAAVWAHVPPHDSERAGVETAHAEIDAGLVRDVDAAISAAAAATPSPFWDALRAFSHRSLGSRARIYP